MTTIITSIDQVMGRNYDVPTGLYLEIEYALVYVIVDYCEMIVLILLLTSVLVLSSLESPVSIYSTSTYSVHASPP